MRLTEQQEAAHRVEMRRWLVKHDVEPVMGSEDAHTARLMHQVHKAGGDPFALLDDALRKVKEQQEGGGVVEGCLSEEEVQRLIADLPRSKRIFIDTHFEVAYDCAVNTVVKLLKQSLEGGG